MDELFAMFFGAMNQSQGGPVRRGPVRPRRSWGTPVTRVLISLLVTLVLGGVYFYFKLPALNIHSGDFYWFLIFSV